MIICIHSRKNTWILIISSHLGGWTRGRKDLTACLCADRTSQRPNLHTAQAVPTGWAQMKAVTQAERSKAFTGMMPPARWSNVTTLYHTTVLTAQTAQCLGDFCHLQLSALLSWNLIDLETKKGLLRQLNYCFFMLTLLGPQTSKHKRSPPITELQHSARKAGTSFLGSYLWSSSVGLFWQVVFPSFRSTGS